MYGFLTNFLVRAVCKERNIYFEWLLEKKWSSSFATDVISWLALSSRPTIPSSIELLKVLGRGATSIVYEGRAGATNVVVKIYDEISGRRTNREEHILG